MLVLRKKYLYNIKKYLKYLRMIVLRKLEIKFRRKDQAFDFVKSKRKQVNSLQML